MPVWLRSLWPESCRRPPTWTRKRSSSRRRMISSTRSMLLSEPSKQDQLARPTSKIDCRDQKLKTNVKILGRDQLSRSIAQINFLASRIVKIILQDHLYKHSVFRSISIIWFTRTNRPCKKSKNKRSKVNKSLSWQSNPIKIPSF